MHMMQKKLKVAKIKKELNGSNSRCAITSSSNIKISIKNPPANDLDYFKYFLIIVLAVILLLVILTVLQFIDGGHGGFMYKKISLQPVRNAPEVIITNILPESLPTNENCSYWDCFNVFRCGRTGHDRITVYVYPLEKYVDENDIPVTETISKEYYEILDTIINSNYYTANPNEACLFIPSIDTLNQDRIRSRLTAKVLEKLPYWSNGTNHLFFNMLAGMAPEFSPVIELNTANAIIAGADFDTYTFRIGFDVSIPIYSPFAKLAEVKSLEGERPWLVISSQLSIDPYFHQELLDLQALHSKLLILDICEYHNYSKRCDIETDKVYKYPRILQKSKYCLVFRGERMGQLVLLEAMAAGCVPVIIMDGVVMPFGNVIDWKRAAVFIMEDYTNTLMSTLNGISKEKYKQLQKQTKWLYDKYFSSLKSIIATTLDIIQDRVYPQWGRIYDDWNIAPDEKSMNPLFLPITAPRNEGFTAVILTYDRVKPIKIIQTKANKLSNRFYPFEEIETEAILSIDDDIIMLTADELEFGYEVWREFPDRLVGFPSRKHIWTTFENYVGSMNLNGLMKFIWIMTGANFYHKE
ncbi:exostosin heparan sulfate glycosyltransferase -related [Holotrichia oblita]|uniref:Exostosin heparan sulfate glycosyltransferase -related n=1 Tax=Holotrichia oblita TaxID=644536 RepID=A0ACB9SRR3_HOLOL|nr:exostosin heparan sulfate glycosyltransferase -related [Holotrichia oblita]